MISKNNTSELILSNTSVFELWNWFSGKKEISLQNTQPLKYSALVLDTDLEIDVNTAQSGSTLEMFLLCPVREDQPAKLNVHLNLLHSQCKIDLQIVSLVLSNAKNQASATIYMQPGIQESASTLLEETVILWNQVNVRNLPILDIQSNNIQAAHGAKIYRLDTEKLFYLQSKGLDSDQARQLLISAYPARLFEGIEIEETEKTQIISEFLTFDQLNHA